MQRPWTALIPVAMVGAAWGLLGATGCSRRASAADAPAALADGTMPIGTPVSLAVEGDTAVQVAHAPLSTRRVIVYLHGRCTEPAIDVERIALSASQHGTLVAPQADEACPGGHGFRWTTDVQAIQPRIDQALRAVGVARGGALDTAEITLVGYSEGAARAEALAHAFPERYPYVILIGAPTTPAVAHLGGARAVALLAGQKDRQDLMKSGLLALEHAGKPAHFFELPGAEHGEFGPDGERVMGEAFEFVGAH
jgi:pimeloyl-ACP methyl ester carboxylesterase